MKFLKYAALALAFVSIGCTENQRAKGWGGTAKVQVPAGQKVVGATWKDAQLWYLTRPMRADEFPETSTLREQSSFGMVEGAVVFTETK